VDVLDEIFFKQSELMQILGMTQAMMRPSGEYTRLYAGDILVACMGMASEAGEVLSEVNVLTRPWARKPDGQAREDLAEEAIDVLFFFVELAILLGLTPADVLRIYNEKWAKNVERFNASAKPTPLGES